MDKITTIEIEQRLAVYFNYRLNVIVPNISWGFDIHECDLLVMRKTGYLLEVEIKVSRSDLKKDQTKPHHHLDNRIKELWFAIPEYLEDSIALIPKRAGILVMTRTDYGLNCRILREATTNNKAMRLTESEQYAIARLGTLRIWSLKRKIIDMRNARKRKHKHTKGQLTLSI